MTAASFPPPAPMKQLATIPIGYPHISRDENGVLRVEGTGYKVIMVIGGYLAWGRDEAVLRETYTALTDAQYHAVLAYYYDHQAELDAELARREANAEKILAEAEAANPEHYARVRTRLHQARAEREASAAPT
jgi:uncharacterized protein (DUF433 family)